MLLGLWDWFDSEMQAEEPVSCFLFTREHAGKPATILQVSVEPQIHEYRAQLL